MLEPVVHDIVRRDAQAVLVVRLLHGARAHHAAVVVDAVVLVDGHHRRLARVGEALAVGAGQVLALLEAELLLALHRDGDRRALAAHRDHTHRVELRVPPRAASRSSQGIPPRAP